MAIVRGAPGAVAYSAASGTSVSVPYPTGNGLGDKLVLVIGQKPSTANSGSVTTPSGWTLVTSITGAGGYNNTLGNDTGNTNLFVFERIVPAGGFSGNLSVTVATNNICWGYMEWLTTDARGWRNSAGTTGSDIVGNTVFGVTFSADPGVQAGDLVLVSLCIPTDTGGGAQFSGQTISQPGVTFGVFGEVAEPSTSVGSDIGGWAGYVPVSAGTSTGAPIVTLSVSGTSTNVRGPAVFLRVRDAYLLSADPGVFLATGQPATLTLEAGTNKSLQADAGAIALTGQSASTLRNRYLNAESGSLNLTGNAASTLQGRRLDANVGAFALTGAVASTLWGRYSSAELGQLTVAGQAASLTKINRYGLDAQPASYSYAGQSADLMRIRALQLSAEAGDLSHIGQSATLTKIRVYALDAQLGFLAVSGQAATLVYTQTRQIHAEAGAFALLGIDATLTKVNVYALHAQAAVFSLSGLEAGVLIRRVISAEPATLAWTLNSTSPYRGWALTAEAGDLVLTGQGATLDVLDVFTLDGEFGTYASTGQSALIQRSKALQAATGSYSSTGQVAQVQRSHLLVANAGSAAANGLSATLAKSRVMPALASSFAVLGNQAQVLRTFSLKTGFGSYGWQGQLAQVLFGRLVLTSSGSYSIQGQSSTALVAVAFELVNPFSVHVQKRPRHSHERRNKFFHQPPRVRVIHEAVQ